MESWFESELYSDLKISKLHFETFDVNLQL